MRVWGRTERPGLGACMRVGTKCLGTYTQKQCVCVWALHMVRGTRERHVVGKGGQENTPGQKSTLEKQTKLREEGRAKSKKGERRFRAGDRGLRLVQSPHPGRVASRQLLHFQPRGIWQAFLSPPWQWRGPSYTPVCVYTRCTKALSCPLSWTASFHFFPRHIPLHPRQASTSSNSSRQKIHAPFPLKPINRQ